MKTKTIQQIANSIARKYGCGRATQIVIDASNRPPAILHHVQHGYRKRSTGEYVPRKYLSNFGWKNTYYQHAETVVSIPVDMVPDSH